MKGSPYGLVGLILVVCTFCASTDALAAAANLVPYAESFESFSDGADIIDGTNNGWYGEAEALVAEELDYSAMFYNEYPLAVPHTTVAKVMGSVSNKLASADDHIWMDMVLQPRPWSEDTHPEDIPTDAQLAAYVSTQGFLTVYCSTTTNGVDYTNRWVTMEHRPIASNDWLRLVVEVDYSGFAKLCRFQINNGAHATNQYGWQNTSPGSLDDLKDGPWLPLLDQNATNVTALSLRGEEYYLDDLVITNQTPTMTAQYTIAVDGDSGAIVNPSGSGPLTLPDSFPIQAGDSVTFEFTAASGYAISNVAWGDGDATNDLGVVASHTFNSVAGDKVLYVFMVDTVGSQTERGTRYDWIDLYYTGVVDYEQVDTNDTDGDGAVTWVEFYAGTIPTNPLSVFQVLDVNSASPSNYVTWYATTNSGIYDPFGMLRSTNLLYSGAWVDMNVSIPRTPVNGTNWWWDTNTPPDEVYYRPYIITNAP